MERPQAYHQFVVLCLVLVSIPVFLNVGGNLVARHHHQVEFIFGQGREIFVGIDEQHDTDSHHPARFSLPKARFDRVAIFRG